jgi:hypothetical protein
VDPPTCTQNAKFKARPTNVVAESQAQAMVSNASARSARLRSARAVRNLSQANTGIAARAAAVTMMPISRGLGSAPYPKSRAPASITIKAASSRSSPPATLDVRRSILPPAHRWHCEARLRVAIQEEHRL